jgi:hypothetical protein
MWSSISPIDKEPPTYNLENQAQKTDSGGIGGSGGILSNIMEGQGQANDDEEEKKEGVAAAAIGGGTHGTHSDLEGQPQRRTI